ncbi:unnamed protein product, partial [marine sediment metagenome]
PLSWDKNKYVLLAGGLKDVNSYVDNGSNNKPKIEAEKDYYYVVVATYGSNLVPSVPEHAETSEKECLENENEFCVGDERWDCNPGSSTTERENGFELDSDPIEDCAPDHCVGPDSNGRTDCIYNAECDDCNDLFGLFGWGGKATEDEQLVDCKDIQNCYYDYTNTTIDKYYDCDDIADGVGCYAYRSKEACEGYDDGDYNNKCFPRDCAWAPKEISNPQSFYEKILAALFPHYFELGDGICREVDEEKQRCD